MTSAVLGDDPTTEPATATVEPASPARSPLLLLLPWLFPLAATLVGLLTIDVPLGAIARYAAYFAVCVVLPGVLLMRALWRSTGNWPEDVGLGAAVGCAFQLAGWALFTWLGWEQALVVWPLLVLAAFAALPPLRRHWRIAEPAPLPPAWSWVLSGCLALLALAVTRGIMANNPAPPDSISYYPDMLYHLSMVSELVRSVPPQLPQVAGESLDYHWFPNADMAGAVDITRLEASLVLFRLWLLPVSFAVVLTAAALARQVSKVWWTGALVGVIIVVPQLGFLLPGWSAVDLTAPLSLLSPSQTFATLAATAAAYFFIAALYRGGERMQRGAWVLGLALATVGGGSKPTVLPLLLGGVGLSALYVLVRDRRIPWRSVLTGAVLGLIGVATMLTVAGSTSGSNLQLFAFAKFQANYAGSTGDRSMPGTGGWVLPSLTGDRIALAGAVVALAALVLSQLGGLVGLGLARAKAVRQDPVAWWLAGLLLAGWLGLSTVDHPSGSEYYFQRGSSSFAAVAVAWLVAAGVRGRSRRSIVRLGLAGLLTGALITVSAYQLRGRVSGPRPDQIETLARPLLVIVGLLVLAGVGWLLAARFRPALTGLGMAFAVLVVIGLPIGQTVASSWAVRDSREVGPYSSRFWRVFPDEQATAGWLAKNSAPDDVVLSNAYCRPAVLLKAGCDARGYVVSGIAGRRTLLDGWAYTQQALATHGVNGTKYTNQPSPWPDRVDLTTQALTAPTPELLARLRSEYGVRWIYADSRLGPVSARLDELAVLRLQVSRVKVYELTSR